MNSICLISILLCLSLANSSPVNEENPYPLTKMLRKDLYQGDILLEGGYKLPAIGSNGKIDESYRWTDKTVIYALNGTFLQKEIDTIYKGMELISSKTCIKFKERTNEESFVLIENNPTGCNSYVGMLPSYWQPQKLNLEYPGCTIASTVAHEFMHALGVSHEHCRPDRDDWMEIHFENVEAGMEHNFKIPDGSSTFNIAYDYLSVMHYDRNAFSKNGKDTMVPKDGYTGALGNWVDITETDVQGLNAMYKC